MEYFENYGSEDLEELEWRLYNEIYHTRSGNEENNSVETSSNTEPTKDDTVVDKTSLKPRPNIRYFTRNNSLSVSSSSAVPLFIPLENTRQPPLNYPVIQNHVTVSANQNSDHNITVNQYTVPVILRSNKISNGKYFTTWATKHRHLLHNKQDRNYKRKQRRMQQKIAQKNSILVYISDDSDDDCVIVNTKTIKQQTKELVTDDDDDDAVIFIPPPPPIIINVEDEEERNEHVGECSKTNIEEGEKSTSPQVVLNKLTNENTELLNTPESSNDFLDNSNIANTFTDFNFGLHGSDFNTGIQTDFARPSNPSHQADFCETESSTASTNDHSGEFNNSVKTIVFDEVEFPKEDIFAEKNLDTFGSLITPKRNSLSKNLDKAGVTESCEQQTQTIQAGDCTSSSSESNADVSKSLNKITTKRLPNLSPMPPNVTEPNLKEIETPKADNSSNSSSESDYERISKKTTKNNVNNTHLEIETDSACKKAKNKRKTDTKDSVENCSFSINESGGKCGRKKKKKKKKRKKEALTFENELENLDDIPERISRGKKKKYLKLTEVEISNRNQKRKKRVSQNLTGCEVHDNSINENFKNARSTPEKNTILSDNSERSKKRRKKSVDISISEKIPDNSDKIVCADKISDVEVKLFTEISDPNNIIESNDELHKTLDEDVVIINDKPRVIEVDESSLKNFANLEAESRDLTLANCEEAVICKPSVQEISSLNQTFDIEEIQRNQSDDPEKWQILDRDKVVFFRPERGGRRCNRCRRFGHIGIHCSEKPEPPRCSLCGESNHMEPRCPNKICRQCGNRGDYSTSYCWNCFKYRHSECFICHMKGHLAETCPDLWRRYHLTVEPGPLVRPEKSVLRPRYQQWCSGCAQRGHLEHECNYFNRQYPPTTPTIMKYDDVLNKITNSISTVHINTSKFQNSNGIPSLLSTSIPNPVSTYSSNKDLTNEYLSLNLDHAEKTVANPEALLANENILPESSEERVVTTDPSGLYLKIAVYNDSSGPQDTSDTNFVKQNILEEMKLNFHSSHPTSPKANDALENTVDFDTQAKNVFMCMSHSEIKQFVSKELEELQRKISRHNPRLLRSQFYKFQRLLQGTKPLSGKSLEKMSLLYRELNMHIFGIHKFRDGKIHLNYLRNHLANLSDRDLNEAKRKSLFNSYSYIFGVNKHVNVSYQRFLKILVQKYDEKNKINKPLS